MNYNEDEPSSKADSAVAAKVKPVTKATAKRKVEAEEDKQPKSNGIKAVKKRKTKAEKEDEAMPLASRTVVATLQKGMHIGAHVSAAGGTRNVYASRT